MSDGWSEVIVQIDEKHDRAHDRLRADLQAAIATLATLTTTVDRNYRYFDDQNAALRLRLEEVRVLAMTPVDATKLTLSTRAIIGVVGAVSALIITVLGTYFATVAKVDSVSRDISAVREQMARMEQQRADDKRESAQRLSDFLSQRLNENLAITNATTKGPKK